MGFGQVTATEVFCYLTVSGSIESPVATHWYGTPNWMSIFNLSGTEDDVNIYFCAYMTIAKKQISRRKVARMRCPFKRSYLTENKQVSITLKTI